MNEARQRQRSASNKIYTHTQKHWVGWWWECGKSTGRATRTTCACATTPHRGLHTLAHSLSLFVPLLGLSRPNPSRSLLVFTSSNVDKCHQVCDSVHQCDGCDDLYDLPVNWYDHVIDIHHSLTHSTCLHHKIAWTLVIFFSTHLNNCYDGTVTVSPCAVSAILWVWKRHRHYLDVLEG